jgi:hypothetical protein
MGFRNNPQIIGSPCPAAVMIRWIHNQPSMFNMTVPYYKADEEGNTHPSRGE